MLCKPLQPGDTVDIIAPGFGVKPQDIELVKAYLSSLGLRARVPDHLMGDDLLSANALEHRLDIVKNALLAKDSQGVWAIKGGYGTAELIPELAKLTPPETPKLLIGFSDITALHCFIHNHWRWPTLHASVLWQIVRGKVDQESITATEDMIFGRMREIGFPLEPLNNAHPGKTAGLIRDLQKQAEGDPGSRLRASGECSRVTGGNGMLLQTSIGTCWEVNTQDNILFIEDIDERAYRVARVLVHLEQAGLISPCRAVVFGDFTFADKQDETEMVDKVIAQFAERQTIPVFRVREIGHGTRNLPLPLNTPAYIIDNRLVVESECL